MSIMLYFRKNSLIKKMTFILSFVFFLSLSLGFVGSVYAQDENENTNEEQESDFPFEFHPSLGIGSTTINGESYIQISGIFEFLIWKIGLGLEIDLQISENGNIRGENWDSIGDWLAKFVYISYGWKGDKPLFAQYGAIFSYTIGHSTIVSSFRNTNNEPLHKRRGLILDLDFNFIGVETFLSDLTHAPITGCRLFIRPIHLINLFGTDISIPILQNLEIGATYAIDTGPDYILIEDGEQASYINIDGVNGALSIYGFDIGLPLINNPDILSSLFYVDYNVIPDLGSGIHTGFYGAIIPASLNIIYKVELLIVFDGYDGSFFNSRYYNDRANKYIELRDTRAAGTLVGIHLILGKIFLDTDEQYVRFALSGKEIFGDDIGAELEASLIMFGLVPKLNINISYLISDLKQWVDFTEFDYHTTITAMIGYQVSGAQLSFIYTRSFIYDYANSQYIPVDTLSIETKIIF